MKSLSDIGLHGLMANQYAMFVTGQNIANANQPFYSRRDVVFTNLNGNNALIADARHMFDGALNRSVQMSNSAFAKSETYASYLKELETSFDNNKFSIANYINESLSALNVANTSPTSLSSRESFLNELKNIASRFNTLDDNIKMQQKNVNNTLSEHVESINGLIAQLAESNGVIATVSDEDRPQLLEKRNELLTNLAKHIDFSMNQEESGAISLQLKNGMSLLLGTTPHSLITYPSENDASQLDIGVVSNNTTVTVTSLLTGGGVLGGTLAYQNQSLMEAKQALGRLALVISQNFNNQNRLGIDLNGSLGRDVFTDVNQLEATLNRVTNNSANQGMGTLSVTINDAGQLKASDYELQFLSATQYQLVRKSDNQVMATDEIHTYPTQINVDGFSLNITDGAFVAGDRFIVSPTKNAASDLKVAIQSGSQLALGLPVVTNFSQQNQGTGIINLAAVTDTTTSAFSMPGQLNPPINIEFISANSYRLVNANDNSIIEDNISYDSINGAEIFPTTGGFDPGYRVTLSGAIAAGDKFSINYQNDASGDNRNGLLLADIYQQGTLDNNTLNFTQAYHLISNAIATKLSAAQLTLDANTAMQVLAESRRDNFSAVSVQEELLNLSRFKQAYEASAQLIEVGNSLLDIVISISGR